MTTFHSQYSIQNEWKRKYNSVMVRGKRIIAVSEFLKAHIIKEYHVDGKNIVAIPRGVDFSIFSPESVNKRRITQLTGKLRIPEDKSVIVLPGRIVRLKGHEYFLEALAGLAKKDFICLFAGTSDGHELYQKHLEQKIMQLGLEGHVRFIGNVSDMPALYYISNIVVSASVQPEGFGRTIVEAQAMGRLVIATDHGGAKETIQPGKTGWLVPPGDVASMTAALQHALSLSPQKRKEITNRAARFVREHYSLGQMVDNTLQVYKKLLGASK